MLNFGQALIHGAQTYPDKAALITEDKVSTYRELNARVNRLANALLGAGIRPGQSVAVISHNTPEALELLWAAAKAGLVFVPVNVMLKRQEIERIFALMKPRACVIEPELQKELPLQVDGCLRLLIGQVYDLPPYSFSYEAFIENSSEVEPRIDVRPDQIFTIIFSSGTTGHPKGIVLTHLARSLTCLFYAVEFGITAESRTLCATPHYHNSLVIVPLPTFYAGGTVFLVRKFSPSEILSRCVKDKITHALLVPTQLNMILGSSLIPPEGLPLLRSLVYTGEAMNETTRQRVLREMTPNLYSLYGLTEGLGVVLHPKDQSSRPGSVGKPILHTEIGILNDQGNPVPAGEIGEIAGRSSRQMSGYYKDPERTSLTVRDGWIYTGDLGKLDAEGFLYVVGRKKEVIISGGVNIFPQDIEQILATHPGVDEVAVLGIPDEVWGEKVKAVVVPRPDACLSAEILATWCHENLPGYQQPKIIEIRSVLPRNPAGKILKQELITLT